MLSHFCLCCSSVVACVATAVVMEWRTCSVCLEEMLDTDLLVHPECGGVLCSPCLQSSIEHFSNSNSQMPCPVRETT